MEPGAWSGFGLSRRLGRQPIGNTEHHTVKTFTPRLCASVKTNLLAQRPRRTCRAQPSGASATRAVGIPEGLLGDRVTTL